MIKQRTNTGHCIPWQSSAPGQKHLAAHTLLFIRNNWQSVNTRYTVAPKKCRPQSCGDSRTFSLEFNLHIQTTTTSAH